MSKEKHGNYMRYILKVLLIAIIGLFLDNNTEATKVQQPVLPKTVFDLPPDTPGLMPDTPNKNVCGQQKACVHVIIPQTEAYKAYTDDRLKPLNSKERAEYACSADGNIYFPADGTQPTAKEVAEYSCANIDNRADSPITKWYMQMFGVIDKNGGNSTNDDDYIKAGFTTTQRRSDSPADARIVKNIENDLIETFRIIASNPIGRLLLYRILIEVRRHNELKEGAVENNVLKHSKITNGRNNCRSISIVLSHKGGAYSAACQSISVNLNKENRNVVSASTIDGATEIIRYKRSADIDLFHEMLHWFHSLRDYQRYNLDNDKQHKPKDFTDKILPSMTFSKDYNDGKKYNIDIAFYHYRSVKDVYGDIQNVTKEQRRNTSARPWKTNYEEMRTILGVPDGYSEHFRNGDDLSENLYRLSKNDALSKNMRFGHTKLIEGNVLLKYFEDKYVINDYKTDLFSRVAPCFFKKGIDDFVYPEGTKVNPAEKLETNYGLGKCRIQRLEKIKKE